MPRNTIVATFFIILWVPWILAISWPRRQVPGSEHQHLAPSKPVEDIEFPLAQLPELTQEEINSLFLHTQSFNTYDRKPDCFRRAAGLIKASCGEADFNEEERVHAAIVMTLCELGTAHHNSPPLECKPFSEALKSGVRQFPVSSQGQCVEALSRSTQYWSSYSGYLREILQLCYTYRRWNDIDVAKEVYRNATLEKVALIRLVLDHEKRSSARMEAWDEVLEEMHNTLSAIRTSSASAEADLMVKLGSEWNKSVGFIRDTVVDLQRKQHDDSIAIVTTQLNATLTHISLDYGKTMSSFASNLETHISSHIETIFSMAIQTQHEKFTSLMNELHTHFIYLKTDLNLMQQSVLQLSDKISILNIMLDEVTDAQLHNIHTTTDFTTMLTQFINTTQTELLHLNNTIVGIRGSFHYGSWPLWWHTIIMSMVEWLWKSLGYLSTIPTFSALLSITQLIAYICQITISSAMSLVVVFFSSICVFSWSQPSKTKGHSQNLLHTYSHKAIHQEQPFKSHLHARPNMSRIPSRLYKPSSDYMSPL